MLSRDGFYFDGVRDTVSPAHETSFCTWFSRLQLLLLTEAVAPPAESEAVKRTFHAGVAYLEATARINVLATEIQREEQQLSRHQKKQQEIEQAKKLVEELEAKLANHATRG